MGEPKFGKNTYIKKKAFWGNYQYLFRFENGFGASVIPNINGFGIDYDLWELGVIKYDKKGDWMLNYDTKITGDVIKNLTTEEVSRLLDEIEKLGGEQL